MVTFLHKWLRGRMKKKLTTGEAFSRYRVAQRELAAAWTAYDIAGKSYHETGRLYQDKKSEAQQALIELDEAIQDE